MEFPPFFRRPYYYYPQSNAYMNSHYNMANMPNYQTMKQIHKEEKKEQINNKKDNADESKRVLDQQVFEIFGIKLYFDDILLIALIFFLYNEGVEDNLLFISLVLLLLS